MKVAKCGHIKAMSPCVMPIKLIGRYYFSIFKEDYHKIVGMEEVAEQSYDAMEAYLLTQEKAKEKLNNAYKEVQKSYDAFAARHNVQLNEAQSSKLSQRLDQAGKVNSYMNQIYLLF